MQEWSHIVQARARAEANFKRRAPFLIGGAVALAVALSFLTSQPGTTTGPGVPAPQPPPGNVAPGLTTTPNQVTQFTYGPGYHPNTGYWAPSQGQNIPPPVDLPIQNLPQETEVWCWAAVSQQIIAASRGMQNTPPQCALVAMANGAEPGVCCNGYNQECVRPGTLDQIQGLISNFGGRPSSFAAPTDPMTLYSTLQQGRAVILSLRFGQAIGHVVVVRGMSFQPVNGGLEPVLHVNDPMAYYTQPIPFRSLVQNWESAIIVN